LYFFVHLDHKDHDEYTSAEEYVANKVSLCDRKRKRTKWVKRKNQGERGADM